MPHRKMLLALKTRSRVCCFQIAGRRKFQAGMSTVFLVLQRQTDLVTARGRELQAQTDLNKAIAELHRAMGNTLSYRNVSVNTEGYKLQQGTASAEPIGGDHARDNN